MASSDEMVLAVEHLAVVQDRDAAQASDGAAGDSGETKDG